MCLEVPTVHHVFTIQACTSVLAGSTVTFVRACLFVCMRESVLKLKFISVNPQN